jgi:small subunit ribosomal protein S6
MRSYELMLVVRPEDETVNQALVEKVQSLITDNGGTVDKLDPWGKRRLAYEIDRNKEGYYTVVNFQGEPKVAHELDRVLKITDSVVRFIIVRPGE